MQKRNRNSICHNGRGVKFWGWLLIVIGLYMVGRQLNLVGEEFPFWGLVIGITGIVLLLQTPCE